MAYPPYAPSSPAQRVLGFGLNEPMQPAGNRLPGAPWPVFRPRHRDDRRSPRSAGDLTVGHSGGVGDPRRARWRRGGRSPDRTTWRIQVPQLLATVHAVLDGPIACSGRRGPV
jgi:hypothetical protein